MLIVQAPNKKKTITHDSKEIEQKMLLRYSNKFWCYFMFLFVNVTELETLVFDPMGHREALNPPRQIHLKSFILTGWEFQDIDTKNPFVSSVVFTIIKSLLTCYYFSP